MPSLRKRVTSYFRQLSFHNEPREKKLNINENTFVTRYLEGLITLKDSPPTIYGKNPTDLPNYSLGHYETGSNTIIGCYSGPNGGLTTVKRIEKHLSMLDADIDFIDTYEEPSENVSSTAPKKSPNKLCSGQHIDNTTMVIKVAGHEYCVTNKPKRHSKSHSLGNINDFGIEIETTKIDKSFYCNNNNCASVECKNKVTSKDQEILCNENKDFVKDNVETSDTSTKANKFSRGERNKMPTTMNLAITSYKTSKKSNTTQQHNNTSSINKTNSGTRDGYKVLQSKSEGNPFHHKREGKIIKVNRPNIRGQKPVENLELAESDDTLLPSEWNRNTECIYGISDSLYDKNQITNYRNGYPIADCFGIIARQDSAILAVADGVNWGEKASIAAKSAVHGSLHYLNKTIFNDIKPFENLTIKTDESSVSSGVGDENTNLIRNTREVFVCLLRAFNCAHDLILENKGMLTTLTVAVVLPLKQKLDKKYPESIGEDRQECETQYVCCVCNVGDTLAYVYSPKYGIRELTKGSHDINCNRDMRDALGALGPVDGINPDLSNLTISITNLQKGDIVIVASDGLTDNFDPNVCKFTVNISEATKPKRPIINKTASKKGTSLQPSMVSENQESILKNKRSTPKPPIKPPRKPRNRDESNSSFVESDSLRNSMLSEKSITPSADGEEISKSQFSKVTNSDVSRDNESNISDEKQASKHVTQVFETSSNSFSDNNGDDVPIDITNPLVVQFMTDNSLNDTSKNINKNPTVTDSKAISLQKQASSQHHHEKSESSQIHDIRKLPFTKTMQIRDSRESFSKKSDTGYKFLRSKTTIDMRYTTSKTILRNEDGIPYVTPLQRYELQLLLMEDILKNGISGKDSPCTSARKLCNNLVSYTISITAAKRHTLEDQDLYYDNRNGVLVEVSTVEKKIRRKKGLEKVQNLPGKLDHVTIVAYNVGNYVH